jgi:hypothetical protein
MGEPLWRTTREKMFERVKKTILSTRREEQAQSHRWEAQANAARWRPSIGAEYWYINDLGLVDTHRWEGDHFDTVRWNMGNVFRSKQKAEQARDGITAYLRQFHKTHP